MVPRGTNRRPAEQIYSAAQRCAMAPETDGFIRGGRRPGRAGPTRPAQSREKTQTAPVGTLRRLRPSVHAAARPWPAVDPPDDRSFVANLSVRESKHLNERTLSLRTRDTLRRE